MGMKGQVCKLLGWARRKLFFMLAQRHRKYMKNSTPLQFSKIVWVRVSKSTWGRGKAARCSGCSWVRIHCVLSQDSHTSWKNIYPTTTKGSSVRSWKRWGLNCTIKLLSLSITIHIIFVSFEKISEPPKETCLNCQEKVSITSLRQRMVSCKLK